MGHTFHRLYYHIVWATHARDPHIHRSFRAKLPNILDKEVQSRHGHPIRHNAMPDHVHLLVRLRPTTALSEFIGQVKGATAFRVNRDLHPKFKLRWQEGYGALTLREDDLEKVCHYIDRQEEHHRAGRLSALLECIEIESAETFP